MSETSTARSAANLTHHPSYKLMRLSPARSPAATKPGRATSIGAIDLTGDSDTESNLGSNAENNAGASTRDITPSSTATSSPARHASSSVAVAGGGVKRRADGSLVGQGAQGGMTAAAAAAAAAERRASKRSGLAGGLASGEVAEERALKRQRRLDGTPVDESDAEGEDEVGGRFTVLTWNVWFEPIEMARRMVAIGREIQARKPTLVALQEVTPTSRELLLALPWAVDYNVTEQPADVPYFTLVALRIAPLQVQRIGFANSCMARDVVVASVEIEAPGCGGPLRLAFATSHLESGSQAATTRVAQLGACLKLLSPPKSGADAAILVGDLNLRKREGLPLPTGNGWAWADAWTELGRAHAAGATMDAAINPYATCAFIRDFKTRYDRVLFRPSRRAKPTASPRPSIVLIDMVRIGMKPFGYDAASKPIFCSDHFGLVATFDVVR
ncbi:endonuclease/Exonuclease/phosphatase [Thecamonas trahens ATCC 50062]|uniref:Endonuclease/Exonuclease/phosphatase n=1 Tax=Thecamonas trahens ATCC 50062 TaxID=461836 RepID=A0A0L0DP69_THETB|nr:endonuclease/Exonuclease/phosphatase [Thecamonas trahens ATCC 50062]KNC54089.1 endonuclease/Exonuclease/phosphatase [Thecamonas trahens ATCC 50062]|eukprot:XP_013754098.1 endonuclease/Exonuclease/phosphatase [Thecamonas trahens ATCC 50062]